VSAAGVLLDRGSGLTPQPHTGEDDKGIRVTIRNIVEELPLSRAAVHSGDEGPNVPSASN